MRDFRSVIANKPYLPDKLLIKKQKLERASNPETESEILDELSDFPDSDVQQKIADNPNASLDTLMKLAGSGFNVHKHPLITKLSIMPNQGMHPLLHPHLISDKDPEIASRKLQNVLTFANHSAVSPESLRILSKHPNVKIVSAVIKSPSITPELLFSLADHMSSYVRSLIARHSLTSPILLSRMEKNSAGLPSKPERGIIASNLKCDSKTLDNLANDSHSWVRRCVAKNPNTDPGTLSRLAFDDNAFVRVSVLKHKKTPLYVLSRMAYDGEPSIRAALARSTNTPKKVLEKLAIDPITHVRYCVAGNINTPASVLDRLAIDTDSKVRSRVARHPNATEQAIERVNSFKYSDSREDTDHEQTELPIIKY